MEGCLTAAKEKCGGFAKEKCLKPFREARIAGVNVKQVERLLGVLGLAMNYRAGELFGSNSESRDLYLSSVGVGVDFQAMSR
ncbi:hypothetical protein ACFX2H_003539 [Malus domestica]